MSVDNSESDRLKLQGQQVSTVHHHVDVQTISDAKFFKTKRPAVRTSYRCGQQSQGKCEQEADEEDSNCH